MLGIFRARFGDKVALLHSGLNASEKYDEWKRLRTGEAKIAIGPRSAIFALLNNLGAIFIDEEHDSSYISENNPRYDTREVAEERARIANAVLVLGSATPDICTYQKACDGKYQLITLPNRISSHKLPDMEIVDMTYEFRCGNRSPFSHELIDAIGQAIERKEQVILFLNRRGFASYMRCRDCGYIPKCDLCDVSLTYHKYENTLKCHYCGTIKKPMLTCPKCGSHNVNEGKVGTEKIVEELKAIFPDVKCLRMDNDTTKGKDSYFKILDQFGKGEADILVGTQMIAKGHDFPNVTLVGIMEADAALFMSDYRASEKTFQLVTQVAGRAGRAEKKGRVILQAFWPSHYVFKFSKTYDYAGFFGTENNRRLVTGFPPYNQLVRVLINSTDKDDGRNSAKEIYLAIRDLQKTYGKFPALSLMEAPLKKLSGQYRFQAVMRLNNLNAEQIINETYRIVGENKPKKGTAFVELNPQNLY
jgi:primosomal protein N' (replication factor Y)